MQDDILFGRDGHKLCVLLGVFSTTGRAPLVEVRNDVMVAEPTDLEGGRSKGRGKDHQDRDDRSDRRKARKTGQAQRQRWVQGSNTACLATRGERQRGRK